MRPDDLERVRTHHSDRADRERAEADYRNDGRIFLGCLAGALFVVAAKTGALRWCIEAALAWWGAR